MTRRPEQTIQRAVFQHLAARPAPGVYSFHVPNGGWRSKAEAAILSGLGVKAGVPDMVIVKNGAVYFLELKAPKGRRSDAQIATMAALEGAGAVCAVATGLDEAIAQLESWGLLRGRFLPADNGANVRRKTGNFS